MVKTVTITAGHSATDPGAVSDNYKEASFCANIRNQVVHYLKNKHYITPKTDGTGSTNAKLSEAIKLAKASQIAVEFHLNSSANKTAQGIEVLASEKDKVFAQAIAQAIHEVTGSPLRGDKGWKSESAGQHSRLGYISTGGGVIVELEFISNAERMQTLNDKQWLVSRAIADVIAQFAK